MGAGDRKLRVITFNIAWHLSWEERRREIIRWLEILDPDVLLLQEHIGDRAEDLARSTGGFFALGERQGPSKYENAIVTRWPIERSASIELPWPAPDARLGRGDEPMGPAGLHVRSNGMDFVSVHLAPAPDQSALRKRQALALADACRAIAAAQPSFPVVMGGDFNADPDSDEIRFLCGAAAIGESSTSFQEAWRHRGEGPGWTLDRRNPFHARSAVPNRHVDYLFVGDPFFFSSYFGGPGQLTGMIQSARLVFDEPLTGTYGSDHFGVLADIWLAPGAAPSATADPTAPR